MTDGVLRDFKNFVYKRQKEVGTVQQWPPCAYPLRFFLWWWGKRTPETTGRLPRSFQNLGHLMHATGRRSAPFTITEAGGVRSPTTLSPSGTAASVKVPKTEGQKVYNCSCCCPHIQIVTRGHKLFTERERYTFF